MLLTQFQGLPFFKAIDRIEGCLLVSFSRGNALRNANLIAYKSNTFLPFPCLSLVSLISIESSTLNSRKAKVTQILFTAIHIYFGKDVRRMITGLLVHTNIYLEKLLTSCQLKAWGFLLNIFGSNFNASLSDLL